MNEFELIDWIKKNPAYGQDVRVGIGDDAAVLKPSKMKHRLMSTDLIVDGVDFLSKELSPEWIGRKALAVNLSDMAAMGARPKEFVISLGVTKNQNTAWLKKFYQGLFKIARVYQVACVGGDLSQAKEFFSSVTILGEADSYQPVLRSTAKAGHLIGVTGMLGGSILKKHYAFEPRVKEGILLAKNRYASSMIDVSDGFAQDLEHILKASKVGAQIDLSLIPISRSAFQLAKGKKDQALQKALSDGEDFELLFTVAKQKKKAFEIAWNKRGFRCPVTWVGEIIKGSPCIHWNLRGESQSKFKLKQKGYQHFK